MCVGIFLKETEENPLSSSCANITAFSDSLLLSSLPLLSGLNLAFAQNLCT